MDFSLYALKNHFLAAGLGFFLSFVFAKKKVSRPKDEMHNSDFMEHGQELDTRINKRFLFFKERIIRLILFVIYLAVFFIFFSYKKISVSLVWTFVVSFLIFFAFFKFKKLMGSAFVILLALFIAFVILFNRSLYILFHEEVIGRIKIVKLESGYVTVDVKELSGNETIKQYKNIKLRGNQFGIFSYRLFYKKWLSFLGLEHKLYWAGVIGLKISDVDTSGRANASAEIVMLDPSNYIKKARFWKMLEKRELILPGVRNVQKDFIFKSPVLGRVYKVIKHRTGNLTIEPEG